MRSTGPRRRLDVERVYPKLPQPVRLSDQEQQPAYKDSKVHDIDEQHGLYGFFDQDKQALSQLREGRAWLPHDLIFKDFQDLHAIWWNCHLEKNRLKVHLAELKRLRVADETVDERMKKVSTLLVGVSASRDETFHSPI